MKRDVMEMLFWFYQLLRCLILFPFRQHTLGDVSDCWLELCHFTRHIIWRLKGEFEFNLAFEQTVNRMVSDGLATKRLDFFGRANLKITDKGKLKLGTLQTKN